MTHPLVVRLMAAVFGMLSLAGCAYRGAIYASYEEAGLGIKSTAESDAPIKVHFGYDRGVGAWVPRRGGQDEEATSLISRDDVRAGVNPTRLNEPLLQVDGAVITGTAAIVASAPAGAVVKVEEAAAPVKDKRATANVFEVRTIGSAGGRIAAALSQSRLSTEQIELRQVMLKVLTRIDKDAVFDAAAAKASEEFQTRFAKEKEGHTSTEAFRTAGRTYLRGDASSQKAIELTAALQAAAREVN